MYQFQEGFPSPMIELRSRSRGRRSLKPSRCHCKKRAGTLGSWGKAQAQLTHQPKPRGETHKGPWRRGLGSSKQARLLTNSPPVCDTWALVSQKGRAGWTIFPKQHSVSARLSFSRELRDEEKKRVVAKNGSWNSRSRVRLAGIP